MGRALEWLPHLASFACRACHALRRHRLLPLVRRTQPRLPAPERADRARLADVHLLLPPARPPLPLVDQSQHAPLAQRDHPRLGTPRLGTPPPPEVGRANTPRRTLISKAACLRTVSLVGVACELASAATNPPASAKH